MDNKYLLDLFTPFTWDRFLKHGANVTGFKSRQQKLAQTRGEPGVIFLCYLVGLSRWCGVLKITSKPFIDDSPIFQDTDDPYEVRFNVEPLITLEVEHSPPITDPEVWSELGLTDGVEPGSFGWGQSIGFRSSLREIPQDDGDFIMRLLEQQDAAPKIYPLTTEDKRKLSAPTTVKTERGTVEVEVPDREAESSEQTPDTPTGTTRPSTQRQAAIAEIGAVMGFNIWIPSADRGAVEQELPSDLRSALLTRLPLNYDDATLRTIQNIDVIWLRRRAIVRAFEVEHTTSVYSGLLRMADLLALQPNMDIALHIVAPDDRKTKVRNEILRPVFSLLESGPMSESCSFIGYSQIEEILNVSHLSHTTDSLLEDYEEYFDE